MKTNHPSEVDMVDVYKAARTDPILYNCLAYMQKGECTYLEAIQAALLLNIKIIETLRTEVKSLKEREWRI